jgi:antibiotic biosynthesis monooxygenase (ABM) superfamily enzyme
LPTEVTTTVICRKIKPGHEKDYNYWVRRYLELERKAPGYLGTTIIIAGGSKSAKAAPKAKFPKLKE